MIRRRRVLFISGFDPRGARHYHEMFRTEAAKAGESTGGSRRYALGPRKKQGDLVVGWTMTGTGPEGEVETRFDFLRWDDVARSLWPQPDWGFVRALTWVVLRALFDGYLYRVYRVRRWYLLTILQPLAVVGGLALSLSLAGVLPVAAGAWAAGLSPWLGLLGLPLGWPLLPRLLKRIDAASSVLWRGQLNILYTEQMFASVPGIEERADAFAELIAAAAREGGVDELLVVGHSVGTTVAISGLARALARHPDAFASVPSLGFVTMGSMTPLLAVEPRCAWFQDEVERLALHPSLAWVDIGAPLDAASFSRVDPLLATGRRRPDGVPVKPLLLSPRFHKLFSAEAYATLKRDRMRLHTQYLMATEKPGPCDFFALTAGPLALAERFADTAADKRR